MSVRGNAETFLLLNVALASYNVGTIWAHELDIFRTWTFLDSTTFHDVQLSHWRKLPYWIFAPIGLAFAGNVALIWFHPAETPMWTIFAALFCQLASGVLTGVFWGRWQAKLAGDPRGPHGPYLTLILKTHWIRTLLICAYAAFLLAAAVTG